MLAGQGQGGQHYQLYGEEEDAYLWMMSDGDKDAKWAKYQQITRATSSIAPHTQMAEASERVAANERCLLHFHIMMLAAVHGRSGHHSHSGHHSLQSFRRPSQETRA